MKRTAILLSMSLLTTLTTVPSANAQTGAPAISEAEASAIAVDAYVYFYPLISMDLTRKQLINTEPGKGFGGPMNTFDNIAAFPTADMKAVVRPNFDTLYSSGWVDLTREPMVVSVPDTGGRYYLLPMLDMWTDVFASPGWRTTGTKAGDFLLAPPGWTGKVPVNFTRINAPTPYVWIIGRTKTDGPADYAAVHAIQKGYKITPLSGWGKPAVAVKATIDPTVDVKTPPKKQVDTMQGPKYFAYAAELLKLHPPHDTDQPIIARLKRIGFDARQELRRRQARCGGAEGNRRCAGGRAEADGMENPDPGARCQQLVDEHRYDGCIRELLSETRHRCAGGPRCKSARRCGLPAQSWLTKAGKPLDGANKYAIRFAKDEMPPVDAFWSITLYDPEGFQVANLAQPLCGEQLDAFQARRRRIADALLPE